MIQGHEVSVGFFKSVNKLSRSWWFINAFDGMARAWPVTSSPPRLFAKNCSHKVSDPGIRRSSLIENPFVERRTGFSFSVFVF